ncbi:MAG: radical SAM family heme chaperone HemW [Clostridiales bacterium]|jgi:oxygen-independent coproporphyrinogen-3 oxidase|nr:radical SAM family heme chaperone HemW [Clostridiales bacterium]
MTGIYIHIPFCVKKCAYCSFVSERVSDERKAQYLKRLAEEIRSGLSARPDADTVYIGGGTPSLLSPKELEAALVPVIENVNLFNPEISMEANPESVTRDKINAAKSLGVNRISLGLQSMSDIVLRKSGRIHTKNDFLRAIDAVYDAGIENISADLMLGLPGQDIDGVSSDIAELKSLPIKHLSVYALKVEEGTPMCGNYEPDADLQADMYETVLTALGDEFPRYEVSNFARAGYECRHNIKYWRLDPYFGFGAAAHSLCDNVRYANPDGIDAYMRGEPKASLPIPSGEQKQEFIMLGLRLAAGISVSEYRARYGEGLFSSAHAAGISKHLKTGALLLEGDALRLSSDAFYIMNTVLTDIL